MKVRYFVIKGKNKYSSIHIRFWNGRILDQKTKTGLAVNVDNWNNTKQMVKAKADEVQRDFINSNLRNLESHIIETYNIDFNSKKHIGNDWLKIQVNSFFGRVNLNEHHKVYFVDWIQLFIDESPKRLYKGKPLSIRTIQHYNTTVTKLKSFETHAKTRLRHENIDLSFYRDFISYCRNIEKLGNNTIGGYITNIKMWCRNIELEGLPINPQFKHSEFMAISNKTKDTYLTENEINTIFNHDFSKSERLNNARDLFVIGLRTGLRVSDFLRLKDINLNKGFIEIETAKTGEPVIIPLHSQIQSVLEKRNGDLPYKISDQKFNLYIKEICKETGINEMIDGAKMSPETKRKEAGIYPKYELISSHTCRRSFASNLYGKLPNMTIMAITGHRTEKQFLEYIKITNQEHAETLKRFWAKEEKEQGYTNVLRKVK